MTIIGEGPERDNLINSVVSLNTSGIEFVGKCPLIEVEERMRNSSFVIIPSIWAEPFGIVGVEGIASGSVVISSDRGGLPEAVGDVGIVFDMDDLKSFSIALNKAAELRRSLVHSADALDSYRKRANKHLSTFSAANIVARISSRLG